uniref:BZIP domain-containing protein n=1 Tax=Panagrolaimus davidi TaxID=227884 RepID=A0A914Q8G4_9BILA
MDVHQNDCGLNGYGIMSHKEFHIQQNVNFNSSQPTFNNPSLNVPLVDGNLGKFENYSDNAFNNSSNVTENDESHFLEDGNSRMTNTYESNTLEIREIRPNVLPVNDINQQFQNISLQDNHGLQFRSTMKQFNTPPFVDTYNPTNHTMLPLIHSEVISNTDIETTESGQESSGSHEMPSPPKNVKKGRGRPKKYKTEMEKKAAKTVSQKNHIKRKNAAFIKLKKEVLTLEKQNTRFEKDVDERLRYAKKMLFDKDLPETEQKVIGAIIGFE